MKDHFSGGRPLYIDYAHELGRAANLEVLISLAAGLRGEKWSAVRKVLSDEIARTSGYLGVDLDKRSEVKALRPSPLLAVWFSFRHRDNARPFVLPGIPEKLGDDDVRIGRDPGLANLLHSAFFSALACALAAQGDFSFVYPGLKRDSIGWLSVAIDHLEKTARSIAAGDIELSLGAFYAAAAEVEVVPFLGNSNEAEHVRYLAFRRALRDIARDLHAVSRIGTLAQQIDKASFALARSSVHWLDELWLPEDVEDERRTLAVDAAREILDDNIAELSKTITVFNERADTWARLARFSMAYELGREKELVRRSAACILGYGYHKDLGAIDVLDAVREAHLAGGADSLEALRRLVPVVEQITTFTDGDETDHVRSRLIELVAKTHPEKLPAFHAHYISREEWRYADECIQEFIEVVDLGSETVRLLASTFMDHHTIGALRKAAEKDDPAARDLLAKQIAFLGDEPVDRHDRSTSSDSLGPEKEPTVEATSFAATDFESLAAEVGKTGFDFRRKKDYLGKWLKHWTDQGSGKQALEAIDAFFGSGRSTYNVEDILDQAFEASLTVEGKKAAYRWLVRAHVHRNGWQTYWASEDEVMRRLALAATNYPTDWWKFIVDTSTGRPYGHRNTFAIGQRYLVRYLALVGKADIASEVASAFVGLLVSEVADQPIPETPWFN